MKKLWQAILIVRSSDPSAFRRRIVYVLLQSLLPIASLYILRLLIDSVTLAVAAHAAPQGILPILVVMVSLFLVNRLVAVLSGVNGDVLSQRLIDHMSAIMQNQSAQLDMAYFDNPSFHDSYHRAQQEASFRPIQILNNVLSLFGSVVSIVGIVVMLVSASWLVVAVMIVAVIPSFIVRLYKARRIYNFRRTSTQLYRRTGYYSALLSSRDYAKEIRAFSLRDFFQRRFVHNRRLLSSKLLAISRRLAGLGLVCALFEAVAMFFVVWLLINRAVAGAITIGSFVMLFEAFRRGQTYLTSLVSSIAALYDNRLFIGNLLEFLELRPSILSPTSPTPIPDEIETVEFRDVTFRYPDMEHDVLSHFSFSARKGSIARLSGQNGYGKSTVVKLLLRFYDPQQGVILINGIDIRQFDVEQLRRSISVLFQDFVRFNCTLRENIAFGRSSDLDAPIYDAARLAGVDAIAETLPNGHDTLLGRLFDGGAEISMGQWQRVALARMLQSDAPILVLDEPMAWLDAESRQKVSQMLDTYGQTRTVILISHI